MVAVHKKSLRRTFWGLSVDESDLTRIAEIVQNATRDIEGDLKIEVDSADGEDTYESSERVLPHFHGQLS